MGRGLACWHVTVPGAHGTPATRGRVSWLRLTNLLFEKTLGRCIFTTNDTALPDVSPPPNRMGAVSELPVSPSRQDAECVRRTRVPPIPGCVFAFRRQILRGTI